MIGSVVGERRHLREAVPHDGGVALRPSRRARHERSILTHEWCGWDKPTPATPRAGSADAARPAARGDVPVRRALRAGQDDDRRRREGVGRLAGHDLPPVPRRPRRAAARDRRVGARQLLQPARRPRARRARPRPSCSSAGSCTRTARWPSTRCCARSSTPSPSGCCPLLTTESAQDAAVHRRLPAPVPARGRPRRAGCGPGVDLDRAAEYLARCDPVADRRARPLGPRRPRPGRASSSASSSSAASSPPPEPTDRWCERPLGDRRQRRVSTACRTAISHANVGGDVLAIASIAVTRDTLTMRHISASSVSGDGLLDRRLSAPGDAGSSTRRSPASPGSASPRRRSTTSPARPAAPGPPSTAASRASSRCCRALLEREVAALARPTSLDAARRRPTRSPTRSSRWSPTARDTLRTHPALAFVLAHEPEIVAAAPRRSNGGARCCAPRPMLVAPAFDALPRRRRAPSASASGSRASRSRISAVRPSTFDLDDPAQRSRARRRLRPARLSSTSYADGRIALTEGASQ